MRTIVIIEYILKEEINPLYFSSTLESLKGVIKKEN